MESDVGRLPSWAKKRLGRASDIHGVKAILRDRGLNTVCESARCPNIGECFGRQTATFMILGSVCTRSCGYCAVDKSHPPLGPDPLEPANIAEAAASLGLKHVVITSVTRDDLSDGGARQFALTIGAIKDKISDISVEVLVPDFKGERASLEMVFEASPDIFNHNLETVPSLYRKVRPQADYKRSLSVLRLAKERGLLTKTGIMAGLGETPEEVMALLRDVRAVGVDAVTIGQYLRPRRDNLEVVEYITPEVFAAYEAYGEKIGIRRVYSGTFVRSSYNAETLFETN
ncbi:MAG: lipoyl synthase [Thermodesulfobacteriota bacterium]